MFNITAKDVLAEVHRLAEERPHFVYGSGEDFDECSYTSAGIVHNMTEDGLTKEFIFGEACIVGQALSRLGVPFELLREHDNGVAADAFVPLFCKYSDTEDLKQLVHIQNQQDNGHSWAEAVK